MKSNTLKINRRFPLPLSIRTTNGESDIRHIGYAGSSERFYICTVKHIIFFDYGSKNIKSTYCPMGLAADDSTIFSVETDRNYQKNYRYLKIGLINGKKSTLKLLPIPWEIRVEKTFTMLLVDRFSKLLITTEHGIHLMDHSKGKWQEHDFVPIDNFLYDYTKHEDPLIGLYHPNGELYCLRGAKGCMKMPVYSLEQMQQTDEFFIENKDGLIIKTEMAHDHNTILLHKQVEKETYLQFYDFRNKELVFTSPKPVTNHAFHQSDKFFILSYNDNSLELFTYPEFKSIGYTDIFSFSPAEKIIFGTCLKNQTMLTVSDDEAVEFIW